MLQLLHTVTPVGPNKVTKRRYKRVRDVVSGGNLYSTCKVLNSILASHTQNKMNKTLKERNWGIRCAMAALFLKRWCIYC